eukprot:TRINITY_DN65561_c0_g1_i1.p1 TRINITY_DN65561_c0_g1~~TRINITY_DN65561_c0_g1_i1.p1  ORF type:complete len:442 (+),score=169.52 TRINITY_DN65561_c0_g1_i1:352-1677(+)
MVDVVNAIQPSTAIASQRSTGDHQPTAPCVVINCSYCSVRGLRRHVVACVINADGSEECKTPDGANASTENKSNKKYEYKKQSAIDIVVHSEDMVEEIMTFLQPRDIGAASGVSRTWLTCSKSTRVWSGGKALSDRDFARYRLARALTSGVHTPLVDSRSEFLAFRARINVNRRNGDAVRHATVEAKSQEELGLHDARLALKYGDRPVLAEAINVVRQYIQFAISLDEAASARSNQSTDAAGGGDRRHKKANNNNEDDDGDGVDDGDDDDSSESPSRGGPFVAAPASIMVSIPKRRFDERKPGVQGRVESQRNKTPANPAELAEFLRDVVEEVAESTPNVNYVINAGTDDPSYADPRLLWREKRGFVSVGTKGARCRASRRKRAVLSRERTVVLCSNEEALLSSPWLARRPVLCIFVHVTRHERPALWLQALPNTPVVELE